MDQNTSNPIKIIYWAWGPGGGGHATRAVAISRWFPEPPLVIRGGIAQNHLLDTYNIPYKIFRSTVDATNFINQQDYDILILDGTYTKIDIKEKVFTQVYYIWRYDRPIATHLHSIYIDPFVDKELYWPIIHLDSSEILDRKTAREHLLIPKDKYMHMVIPSLVDDKVISGDFDFVLKDEPLKYMAAADKITAAIGYNTFSEVSYHGIETNWRVARNRPDQLIRYKNIGAYKSFMPDVGKKIAEYIMDRRQ